MKPNENEKLITGAELAQHLGTTVEAIGRLTREGRIPVAVRLGKVKGARYVLADVLAALAPQEKSETPA